MPRLVWTMVWSFVAFLLGIPLGFLFAFNAVFADGSDAERAFALALVGLVFLITGVALGAASPASRVWLPWSLALPTLVILAVYTTREPQNWLLHSVDAALALAGAFGGVQFGALLRRHPKAA